MFRLSLIGPGDVDFHYYQLLKLNPKKLKVELEKIAKAISESDSGIELTPDTGVCLDLAKIYRQIGGKEIVGTVPEDDKTFGVNHLQEYINLDIEGKPLFDEIINTGTWFKHNLIKGLMGNAILYLGSSPGTEGERHFAVYLYKIIKKLKESVKTSVKDIHPQIRAGDNFSILIYTPYLLNKKLHKEDEEYMKRFGINLVYIKDAKHLKKELAEIMKKEKETETKENLKIDKEITKQETEPSVTEEKTPPIPKTQTPQTMPTQKQPTIPPSNVKQTPPPMPPVNNQQTEKQEAIKELSAMKKNSQ